MNFSEANVAYHIKVDICNQSNDFYKYQSSRSFISFCPGCLRFRFFYLLPSKTTGMTEFYLF